MKGRKSDSEHRPLVLRRSLQSCNHEVSIGRGYASLTEYVPGSLPPLDKTSAGDLSHARCLDKLQDNKKLGIFQADSQLLPEVAHRRINLHFILLVIFGVCLLELDRPRWL